mmetsp:Transcript_55731/g.156387  ORF Transcript_55731/g.156387 Transcript_55731/m.156387 type:complete len:81 (+) Transcript_55731:687-929(+)
MSGGGAATGPGGARGEGAGCPGAAWGQAASGRRRSCNWGRAAMGRGTAERTARRGRLHRGRAETVADLATDQSPKRRVWW